MGTARECESAKREVGVSEAGPGPVVRLTTESAFLTSFAGSETDDSEGFVGFMMGTNVPEKGAASEDPLIDWSSVPRPGPLMSSLGSRHWSRHSARRHCSALVELFSSPGDEGSLSMLKKAVTCPSVLAPGAPGVSNGDCWDCLVSPCFIIDLPVHTRTPDVTDPITPLTGSRGGHLQGDTDSVSDPWLPGKLSLQAALSIDYVVSNIRYLLRCFEPACIYAGNCRFRSLSSLRPSRLRFAPAATPLNYQRTPGNDGGRECAGRLPCFRRLAGWSLALPYGAPLRSRRAKRGVL